MTENTEQLIPIPALPPVPINNTHKILRYDGINRKIIAIDAPEDKYLDWCECVNPIDILDPEEVKAKDGSDTVVYRLASVPFGDELYLRFLPVTYAKQTYIYDRETNLYSEDTGELASWATAQVQMAVYKGMLPKTTKTDAIVREVVLQAQRKNVRNIDKYPFNDFDGFPVGNCVIQFNRDGTITTHDYRPDMMFTRKSPIDYNPNASTEKAERVLKTWLDGEDQNGNQLWEYLVQIPAQAVYQSLPGNTPFKLAYMLVGEHDSGRSTFNMMLQCFFGHDNISTIALHNFTDRFAGGDLLGKYMNFGDDLPSLRINEGNQFKQLVGIPEMSIERKYQDRFMARITAVHAYSANDLPKLDENIYTDEAWWSRWVILKWNNHFARDPEWMKNNLDNEFFEGFMLLVIGEVCKIIKNHGLILTQDPELVKTEWLGSETKVHEFIAVSIEHKIGAMIDSTAMLESIRYWADKFMPTPPSLYDSTIEQDKWRERQKKLLPKTPKALTQALHKEGIAVKQIKVRYLGEKDDGKLHSEYVYENVQFRIGIAWKKTPNYTYPRGAENDPSN